MGPAFGGQGVGVPLLRPIIVLGLAALSLSGGGCVLVHDAASLTTYKVKESVGDCFEQSRNRKWAGQAWQNVRAACPQAAYSKDYEAGFEDGFAHYLFRGGNGEPPPLPPRHYRKITYQTPQGYRAIEDWFAGYRHGAAVARESGYREFVTGPSALRSVPPPPVVVPGPVVVEPPPLVSEPVAVPPGAPPEPLAEPQTLPPPAVALPGPRVRARILSIRSLGPVVQPEL
jgi:hypothetical protein